MKVKELKKGLEKVDDELEIIVELFGVKNELEAEDIAIMDGKELIISLDGGAFISSPFTSDNE